MSGFFERWLFGNKNTNLSEAVLRASHPDGGVKDAGVPRS